jgi:putative transposase
MTEAELDPYLARLPATGQRLVRQARRESPVRQVQSRIGNVITRFVSRKMQRVIVGESRTVELPAIVRYEHDVHVLEYYAQPVRLNLRLTDGGLKKPFRLNTTPDFLVLMDSGIAIDEWRTSERMQRLSKKYPGRFEYDGARWRWPEVQEFLAERGIDYRIRTDDEHPHVYVQNLRFLADYYSPECLAVEPETLALLQACFVDRASFTLAELIDLGRTPETCHVNQRPTSDTPPADADMPFTADDIYKAIADGDLIFDLDADLLSETYRSCVHRDEATLAFWKRVAQGRPTDPGHGPAGLITLQPGTQITYGTVPYEISLVGTNNILLRGEQGMTELSLADFDALRQQDRIRIKTDSAPQITETRPDSITLSPVEIERALTRARALDLVATGVDNCGVPKRTLQRWAKLARDAGENSVSRNLALAGAHRARGNRTRKIPEEVLDLIRECAKSYNRVAGPSMRHTYLELQRLCHGKNLTPCSLPTFRAELKRLASTRAREGKRREYHSAPIVWYLNAKDPLHGVRPFEIVHIDETPLDVVAVAPGYPKPLGRPWLSLAVDADSRSVLGFYLSFRDPSEFSCIMVLRDIVRRHGHMPELILTDNGPGFRSGLLRRVCETYRANHQFRPPAQPRFGSVMERLFQTTNTEFVHNLEGNTKLMKHVRTVTKSVRPERFACWTLPALHGGLDYFFRNVYGKEFHPAHGEAPAEYLARRFLETGCRAHRLLQLDRTFLIETCPPADATGTRVVDSQRGIRVHYLWFWTEAFRDRRWHGKSVPVRVDPWDARYCYALLERDWHRCACKLASQLAGVSRVELETYFEERAAKQGIATHLLSPERVAEWMRAFDPREFDRRLRVEQLEARSIYEPLALSALEPVGTVVERLSMQDLASESPLEPLSPASNLEEDMEEYGLY